MIFDTNVLIYLSKNILKIENLIKDNTASSISIISYIEALGFPFVTEEDQRYMLQICSSVRLIQISEDIVSETIKLRGSNRIKLPDAIIYATALVKNEPLLTNNTGDFKSLGKNVELINPFDL